MSLAISSHLIYNVNKCLRTDKLQFFETFLEHAKMARKLQDDSIFQSLTFLVRDWADADEFPYGSEAGEVYVETQMKGRTHNNVKRSSFKDLFHKVTSFLLPYPGKSVAESSAMKFSGSLQDIEPEFLEYVDKLVHFLFDPIKIVIKQYNDEPVKGSELTEIAVQFAKILEGDELPTPKDFLQAQTEAFLANLIEEMRRHLKKKIVESLGERTFVDEELFCQIANDAFEKAKIEFEKKPFYGGAEARKCCEMNLVEQLQHDMDQMADRNNTKKIQCRNQYEEFIKKEMKEMQTSLEQKVGQHAEATEITRECQHLESFVAKRFQQKGFGVPEYDEEYIATMNERITELCEETIRSCKNRREVLKLSCIQKISEIEEEAKRILKEKLDHVVIEDRRELENIVNQIIYHADLHFGKYIQPDAPDLLRKSLNDTLKSKLDKLHAVAFELQRKTKRYLSMIIDRELGTLRRYYSEAMHQEMGESAKNEKELDKINVKCIETTKKHLNEMKLLPYVREKCIEELDSVLADEYVIVRKQNKENQKEFHDWCRREVTNCLKQAKNEIEEKCRNDVKEDQEIEAIHDTAKLHALESFQNLSQKGPEKIIEQHKNELCIGLVELLRDVRQQNQNRKEAIIREMDKTIDEFKQQYKDSMNKELKAPAALEENVLKEKHEGIKDIVMEDFMEKNRLKPEKICLQSKADLNRKLNGLFNAFKQENKNKQRNLQQKQEEIVRDSLVVYNKEMNQACESLPDESQLEEKHKEAEKLAIDKITQVKLDETIRDNSMTVLSTMIEERYLHYKKTAADKKKWAGSKCEEYMARIKRTFERAVESNTGEHSCSATDLKNYFSKAQRKAENALQNMQIAASMKKLCAENMKNAIEDWKEDLTNTNKEAEVEFKALCKDKIERCAEHYNTLIKRIGQNIVEEEELTPHHDRAKEATLKRYDRQELVGNKEIVQTHKAQLEENIESDWSDFRQQQNDFLEKKRNAGEECVSEAQTLYKEEMKKVIGVKTYNIDTLNGFHDDASDTAQFKIEALKLPKVVQTECFGKLQKLLKNDFSKWKLKNEELKEGRKRSLEKYVNMQCIEAYKQKMEELCGSIYCRENTMVSHHRTAVKHVIAKFNSYDKLPEKHLPDENVLQECLNTLKELCEDEKKIFDGFNKEHKVECEKMANETINAAAKKYSEIVEMETKYGMDEYDLKTIHSSSKQETKKWIDNKKSLLREDVQQLVEEKFEGKMADSFEDMKNKNQQKIVRENSALANMKVDAIKKYKRDMEHVSDINMELENTCFHSNSEFDHAHYDTSKGAKGLQIDDSVNKSSSRFEKFRKERNNDIEEARKLFFNKHTSLMKTRKRKYQEVVNEHAGYYRHEVYESKKKADRDSFRISSKQKDMEAYHGCNKSYVEKKAAAKLPPAGCPSCSSCVNSAKNSLSSEIDKLYEKVYESLSFGKVFY
uniref:nucleoprotein TPR-like n=1 Tax=Styela clava TaxID=7725 RepID=UPI00193AB7C2|nr:nucleoprotein TPR-like [Styela clava]